jgi:histidine triad (HIT) family protein
MPQQIELSAMPTTCIFCAIIGHRARAFRLYDDDDTFAFMDIHPANDGHCLVIPKRHYETIFEMSPEDFAAVARTVVRVARAVHQALQPGGLNLVQANGPIAGQSVGHVHVHVLPRREDDNLWLNWPRNRRVDPADIAQIAERIRAYL